MSIVKIFSMITLILAVAACNTYPGPRPLTGSQVALNPYSGNPLTDSTIYGLNLEPRMIPATPSRTAEPARVTRLTPGMGQAATCCDPYGDPRTNMGTRHYYDTFDTRQDAASFASENPGLGTIPGNTQERSAILFYCTMKYGRKGRIDAMNKPNILMTPGQYATINQETNTIEGYIATMEQNNPSLRSYDCSRLNK